MAKAGGGRAYLPVIAALTALYFVAGKLGLTLAFVNASATAVWPPTGIALAAFLLLGYRVWPGILLGAFLVNGTTAGSVLSSLGIAAGNTLEGLVGAYLVNRFAGGRGAFERPQDVFKFAFLAAILATAISATCGVTSLSLTGSADWSNFGPIWLTWWLGDAAGALVVAPLLVLWGAGAPRPLSRARALEAAALLLALVLTGLVVFGGFQPLSVKRYPIEFLTFPALVWAAFRFGPRATATACFLLSGLAIGGTLRGLGPFAGESPNESLLLLQAFMGVAAVMSLALAAAVLERQRAEARTRAIEEQLRQVEARKQEEAQAARLALAQAARAEAEAAVAARDEFLSVAAHELKTPLTGLQLAVQLLLRQFDRDAPLDPAQFRRALDVVERQSVKLARLVTQLLETVRLQGGRLELDRKVEDVSGLVARAVEQAQATTRRHELALSGPPAIRAQVDALRLEQVIVNLLDNAIKFSPDGGRIDVELTASQGAWVRLAVRDRGIGIPAERRPHIFERFYQAHAQSAPGGLGLGLYVSRRLVELHGGEITAEFPEDGGTRFVVRLPADTGAVLAAPAPGHDP
jgi:signal transduction histidine kinase